MSEEVEQCSTPMNSGFQDAKIPAHVLGATKWIFLAGASRSRNIGWKNGYLSCPIRRRGIHSVALLWSKCRHLYARCLPRALKFSESHPHMLTAPSRFRCHSLAPRVSTRTVFPTIVIYGWGTAKAEGRIFHHPSPLLCSPTPVESLVACSTST